MSFKRCTADYGSLSLKAMSCSEDDNGDLLERCETSDGLYYCSLSLGPMDIIQAGWCTFVDGWPLVWLTRRLWRNDDG